MNSSVHIDNMGKNILIPGKYSTERLDDTTLTAEAQYWTNFTKSNRKFCLRLHYNGRNSFLFVDATKIYHLKAKGSEIRKKHL